MFGFLSRQPRTLVLAEALLLLFAIAWLDLATGYEITLTILYALPILLVAWFFDNMSAFLFAGLVAMIWAWVDVMSGHPYSSSVVQGCEMMMRFMFYFFVALAAIGIREKHAQNDARISLLEHARKLEKQIIEVSEYEQQRIGRDLHDGLCQCLAAIGCAATSLRMDLDQQGLAKLATTAAEIENLLRESVRQARDLAHGLVPVQLNEAGLPAALQELTATTSRLQGMVCTFEFAGEDGFTHPGKATHLYRIAQEAINNATKHGKARNVEVKLSANSSAMNLSIADDGTGFKVEAQETDGVGISIMRYRATVVGGEFQIESGPKGGTIVSCMVPAGTLTGA
jgi:signal transduction histidine kinase